MDCGEKITSEDYFDFIVNSAYFNMEDLGPRGCYIDVNERIVNLYFPIEGNPPISLENYSYEGIPNLYTIMEETENVSESIFTEIQNRQQLDGEGIMLGFVDTGIDYRSPAFRNPDGSSRIRYIWDQSIKGTAPEGYYYGSEYTKEQIDAALRAVNPKDVVPSSDDNGHGTYIASIACGAGVRYIKTVLYVRLSSVSEGKNSLENQIEILRQYVKNNPPLKEEKLFVDYGCTGTNFARPAFEDMMNFLREGKAECVIVKDLSRLGRNYIETGLYVEKVFPLMGVRLISLLDNYDSSDAAAAGKWLEINLTNLINEMYAKDSSKRITSSVCERQKTGSFMGTVPPYGYTIVKENGIRKLVIDEKSAEIVREIFVTLDKTRSITAVKRMLDEDDINPPGIYRKTGHIKNMDTDSQTRSGWQLSTIYRMCQSIVYIGHLEERKTNQCLYKNVSRHKVDDNERIIIKNTHEAIISEELFYRCISYTSGK